MMQPDDQALLEDARAALAKPFCDPVRVGGGADTPPAGASDRARFRPPFSDPAEVGVTPPTNRALVALCCLSGAIVLALVAALGGWL